MKVTYLGTTVLLFDDGKDQLLFDAYLSRQSIFRVGWGKMRTRPETVETVIRKHDMHRLRGIFISHTHLDHVLDLPYIAAQTGAEVYGSPSALNVARGGNIPEKRLQSYQTQRVFRIGDFEVTVLDSLHSKAHWYNNDLGKTIDVPLVQPASRKEYREGGSYDFVVRHGMKTYVIRPSCNYVEGELQGIRADVLYLGIGGLSGCDADFKAHFFRETIQETAPGLVIPIHWDHFFKPLDRISYCCTGVMGNTEASMFELAKYCGEHGISCAVQLPMTCMDDAGLRKPLMDQLWVKQLVHQGWFDTRLIWSNELRGLLESVQRECFERLEVLTPKIAETEGINEALKANDQLGWVQRMNNIRNRAEEMILIDMIR